MNSEDVEEDSLGLGPEQDVNWLTLVELHGR